jgi:hypothetical protein
VQSDTNTIGLSRTLPTATGYGLDGMGLVFGGYIAVPTTTGNISKISNQGDVISDTTQSGVTGRGAACSTTYGGGNALLWSGGTTINTFTTSQVPIGNPITVNPTCQNFNNVYISIKYAGRVFNLNSTFPIDLFKQSSNLSSFVPPDNQYYPPLGFNGTIVNRINSEGVITSDEAIPSGVNYSYNFPEYPNNGPKNIALTTGGGGAGYGGDKGIMGYGDIAYANKQPTSPNLGNWASTVTNPSRAGYLGPGFTTNLVTNTGVIGKDIWYYAFTRRFSYASTYGGDKVVFAYGLQNANNANPSTILGLFNLINNQGIVESEYTTPTARAWSPGAGFGS